MNSRERFLKTINFEQPDDRLPMVEWAAWWDKTIERWQSERLQSHLDWDGQLNHFDIDVLDCISASIRGPGCPQPDHHGAGIITDEESY